MPPNARQRIRRQLRRADIEGNYSKLIRQAIIHDWTEQQFAQALVRTKAFRRQHPGLVKGGQINDFLLGQENAPLNFSNLERAVANYRTLHQSYETAGRAFGYGKLSKRQVAALINGEKSPEEFAASAQAVQQVKQNKQTLTLFNEQRKAAGLQPLDNTELFRAFAGRDRSWVDVYEATRLRMLGNNIGLTAQEAQAVAKAVPNVGPGGASTGPGNIGALVSDLRTQLADIGPELERDGISKVQLAQFLANPDEDRLGIAQRIAQLQARRRGMGQYQQGATKAPSQGSTPGPAAYG